MTTLNPYRVETSDGVQIILNRLQPAERRWTLPVLVAAGTFSNRIFWLGTQGQGFGRFLAQSGFEVWILEPRGHGESERPRRWTLDDWILRDAPAALERMLAETGAEEGFWVGHSAGGVVGAAMVGRFPHLARRLRGLVLVGSPGPRGLRGSRRWIAHSLRLGATLFPRASIPGTLLGLGPEPEPAPLVRQWMGWNLGGAWRAPDGGDYLEPLIQIKLPLLMVAGAGDRLLAPPESVRDLYERFGSSDRTLVLAGREQGFSEDYDHAELLVSRSARSEIWPLLIDWLQARAQVPAVGSPAPERGATQE